MKKNVIALMLSFAVIAGIISTNPVCAADTGATAVEEDAQQPAESMVLLENDQPEEEPAKEEPAVLVESEEDALDIYEQEEMAAPEVVSSNSQNSNENVFRKEGTCGDNITWVLTGTNPDTDPDLTLTISGTGRMSDFEYPADWTLYNKDIRKVVIEDGVTGIGSRVFCEFYALEEIVIPKSVTSIGEFAFYCCYKLDNVTIPNGVINIGYGAFYHCSGLKNIMLSDTVTDIGGSAFYRCYELERLEIPAGLTGIGAYALCECEKLIEVTLPDSVIYIGEGVFRGCSSLTSIQLPSGTTQITDNLFAECSNLKNINLPSGVTTIGECAFGGCSSLTGIKIPDKVTSIGKYAFTGCSSLTSITIPNGVTDIEASTFSHCFKLVNLTIPAGLTSIGDSAFEGCGSLKSIIIPNKVTSIGRHVFDCCSSLSKVTIPNSVTGIGEYAFYGCSSLTDLKIPDSITVIEKGAFAGCSSLTIVTLPESITTIGEELFRYCGSLTDVSIPDGVTSIGAFAFGECGSLININIPDNVISIREGAFHYCNSLTEMKIPDGVTQVADYLFDHCTNLKYIDLPSGVTKIGKTAFQLCGSLTEISIPENVNYIGEWAFNGCNSLTSITIPNGIKIINSNTFSGCTSLTDVSIPDSVTIIAENAFQRCTSLIEISIPESVTGIGDQAFFDCVNLEKIIIPYNVTHVGIQMFVRGTVPRTLLEKITIYGYAGSYAEKYAYENEIPFVALGGDWVDNTGIPHYYTIALQAASTGRYITCDVGAKSEEEGINKGRYENMDNPDLNADATRVMAYEEFELVPCSDGSYALRSVMNRKYITCYSCCLFTSDANGKLVKEDWVLRCDSDFVRDGSMTVEKNSATYGFLCDYVETAYLKLYLTEDSSGNRTLKFRNGDRWLCVEDGKLSTTNTVTNAELFKLILLDDNQYSEEEQRVLSGDEWFNIDNRGFGGLYGIQCDVGKNSQYNAKTLKNLGYTLMYLKSQFLEHDYIKIDEMQCFVAYKKDNDNYDVIIAFQGTDGYGLRDWWNDAMSNMTGNVLPTYTDLDGMHAGYHQMAMKLEENKDKIISGNYTGLTFSDLISAAKNKKAQFTILGHSMGGAIAQCYAVDLLKKEHVPVSQIRGRTFNSALAVNSDYEEYSKDIDWYNICVSSDSVCNGLVPGSIIYYGLHRLGKTIWLYDLNPDDNNPDGVANISNNKHVMDDYACLHTLLYQAYSRYRCKHKWDEGILRTVIHDGKVEYERIYTCTKCEQIKIEDLTSLSNEIEVSGLKTMVYTGLEITPHFVVKYGDRTLEENVDYEVTYKNNINAGTATVTITGKGNFAGTISRNFTIKKATTKLVFAESTVTKKTTDAAFTNTLTKTTDGKVTFTSSDKKVAEVNSTSGLVTIKGVGTATITATASEGKNYKAGSAGYTIAVKAMAAAVFSDVQDPTHPYYKAILWAAGEGITKGYSDGTFGVDKSCTRGEMMMFLWKYAGKPAPKSASKSPFKDVPTTHSFYKAILWGYQNGITKGYSDGSFGINRDVSRGEAMMFLWKLKGKPTPKAVAKSPFKDVSTSHAFYKAILWGSQKGITKGYTSGPKKGNFGINDNCTRGQIVTFLYRAK